MKKLIFSLAFMAALLIPGSVRAQYVGFQNFCVNPAVKSLTSGQPSSNYLQGIIPYCTVTVYLTGTTTKANIYSDTTGTVLTNPFQAPANGQWLFYSLKGQGYDVQLKGGLAPNTYPTPVTLTDLEVATGCSTAGPAGTLIASDGSGGCESLDANFGISLANGFTFGASAARAFSVNATDIALIYSGGFTITGANTGTCSKSLELDSANHLIANTCQPLSLQHAGTPVTTQTLMNWVDTPASLSGGSVDVGYQPVVFKTDTAGGWAAETQQTIVGNGLSMQAVAPTAGTFIKVYPSGFSTTGSGVSYSTQTQNNTSAKFTSAGCTLGGCAGTWASGVTWTFTLPSYVNPANVTAVWASGNLANYAFGNGNGHETDGFFHCDSGVNSYGLTTNGGPTSYGVYYLGTQQNVQMSAATGSSVNSITCHAEINSSSVVQAGMVMTVGSIYLQLADTVDTAPTSTALQIVPPLILNTSDNTLRLNMAPDLEIDTGAANAYVVTDANMFAISGLTIRFTPGHNSTSATPTLSLNGSSGTIVGPTGLPLANGDIITSVPAIVVLGNGTGNWLLQNPQKSQPTSSAGPSQTVVSSSTTIAPTARYFHVSGTTTIQTVTAPAFCVVTGTMCQITIIPDGLWSTTTGGNIAIATTAVVSKALIMTYDPATTTWYPSY